MAAAVAVFARFDREVIYFVTDPYTGIASRSKFLPTISEIREACEQRAAEIQRRKAREESIRAQLAEREEIERIRASRQKQEPRQRGTTYTNYDEAVQKHGVPIGAFDERREHPYEG